MDELDLLATARPVDPPAAQTVDAARRRLTREIYAKPKSRWRPRVLLPVAAGALAVSTGLVLGAHVLSPAPPAAPPSGTSSRDAGPLEPDHRPARELLLTAAEHTLAQPDPGKGKYWTSTYEEGQLIEVGKPGNRYAIMGGYLETSWVPAGGEYVVRQSRWVGAEPASAADKAAWRKAGSPSSWPMDPAPGCPVDPENAYTAAASGTAKVVKAGQNSQLHVLGEALTSEQIRALPSDPAALKTWLIGVIKKQNLTYRTDAELGERLFDGVVNLLFENPIAPPVRSAAYRMLAGMPGVTSLGAVRDAEGRHGVAVTIVRNDTVEEQRADPGGPMQVSVVFDPDSGQTLALETRAMKPADYLAWVPKGALVDYRALKSSRWTDDEPPAANAPASVMHRAGEC